MNPFLTLHPIVLSVAMLALANVFMTVAWYGHLRHQSHTTWYVAALLSWGIALFEYLIQVPANRIGHEAGLSVGQLKIIQEVITLVVFGVFSVMFLKEPIRWNHYVGFSLILLAVIFMQGFEKSP